MRILISEAQLDQKIRQLALQLNQHYADRPVTVLGILTGSIVLISDLIRLLNMPIRVGVLQTRSYTGSNTTPGPLKIEDIMMPDIQGREVLLVDDIFDTGQTLLGVLNHLDNFNPKRVKTLVLLHKEGRQEVAIEPDYYGFKIPDEFVVGYGLDFQDHYRNLPYVAALDPEEIEAELA